MCVLESREVFTDTCFSHSYVTLLPSGLAPFGYMLLFISDHCTIRLLMGLLESTVSTWRDTGNRYLSFNPLRHPNPYLWEGYPVLSETCPRNPCDGQHRGDGCSALIWGNVKHCSDVSINASVVPAACVWETLAQKAALAPMGKACK